MKSSTKTQTTNPKSTAVHRYRILLVVLLLIILAGIAGYCIYAGQHTEPPADGVLIQHLKENETQSWV